MCIIVGYKNTYICVFFADSIRSPPHIYGHNKGITVQFRAIILFYFLDTDYRSWVLRSGFLGYFT